MIDDAFMAEAIRSAVKESGLTQRDLAEAFDVSVQAVSGWMRLGKIDKRKLPLLASMTGKPLSHFGMADASLPVALAAKLNRNPDYVRFELLDVIAGMGPGQANADRPEVLRDIDIAAWEVRRKLGFLPRPGQVQMITGRGHSMRPIIENGDVALVDTDITHFDGDALYAISIDSDVQIKMLQRRPNGLHVVSANTDYPSYHVPPEDSANIHILGKVLATLGVRQP